MSKQKDYQELLNDDVWKAYLNLVAYRTLNTNVYLLKDKGGEPKFIAHSDAHLSPFCQWIQTTEHGKTMCACDHVLRGRLDNKEIKKTHLCWAGMNNRLVVLNQKERLGLLAGQIRCQTWEDEGLKRVRDAIKKIWDEEISTLNKNYINFDRFLEEGLGIYNGLPVYPQSHLREVSLSALKIFKDFYKKDMLDKIRMLSIFHQTVQLGSISEDFYTHVAEKMTELLHAHSASILLNHSLHPDIFHIVGSTEIIRDDFNVIEYSNVSPRGKTGYVLSTGKPLIVDDAKDTDELSRKTNIPDFNWDGPNARMHNPHFVEKAWIGVPIFRASETKDGSGKVVGMLRAAKDKGEFDLEDLAVVVVFSNLLSNIISTRHWFNERQNTLYFLERLFASCPDPVIYSTFSHEKGKGGIIEKINPAVTEMLGFSENDLIGRHVYIPYGYQETDPRTLNRAKCSAHTIKNKLLEEWNTQRIIKKSDSPLQITNFPVSLYTKSGNECQVWLSASLVEDVRLPVNSPKRIIGVIGIFRDRDTIEHLQKQIIKQDAELKRLIKGHNSDRDRILKRFQDEFGIITVSDKMLDCFKLVLAFAVTQSPILLTGERGVGKELFARAIHSTSSRCNGVFLPVTSLAPTLADSELFGYEKGSFTGATISRKGKFESANGGTIFLDDFDTFPLDIQGKLLRVLQDNEIQKIGCSNPVKINVRVIVATNVDLVQIAREGKFRRDLVDRINVLNIHIPPLRERKEDIPILVNHYVRKYSEDYKKRVPDISPSVINMLVSHPWYGNVRELINFLNRLVIESDIEDESSENITARLLDKKISMPNSEKLTEAVIETNVPRVATDANSDRNLLPGVEKIPRSLRRRAVVSSTISKNPGIDSHSILNILQEHGLECDIRTVQLHIKSVKMIIDYMNSHPHCNHNEVYGYLLENNVKDKQKIIDTTLRFIPE